MTSSVKGATGHLVAAAGALNAAVAALAVARGAVPPTLEAATTLDPELRRLDWVTERARARRRSTALALARGFEGQNVALALRRA